MASLQRRFRFCLSRVWAALATASAAKASRPFAVTVTTVGSCFFIFIPWWIGAGARHVAARAELLRHGGKI